MENIEIPFDEDMECDEQAKENKEAARKRGRPRNPVPRHKRSCHIEAEKRRRENIRAMMKSLKDVVPSERDKEESSQLNILNSAIKYIQELEERISSQRMDQESRDPPANLSPDPVPARELPDDIADFVLDHMKGSVKFTTKEE